MQKKNIYLVNTTDKVFYNTNGNYEKQMKIMKCKCKTVQFK